MVSYLPKGSVRRGVKWGAYSADHVLSLDLGAGDMGALNLCENSLSCILCVFFCLYCIHK